jgi:hypothetical protein
MGWGNGEIKLASFGRSMFYLSPGIGFVRNGSRDMSVITPLGTATSHILPGTAVTFNLGAGIKFFPFKRVGFRFDLRDHISGGGTGSLTPQQDLVINSVAVPNPAQYFGPIPIQNNIVFTVGLIFKIL